MAQGGCGLSLQEDATYAKFFKMLKMHVPKMAVAGKMAAEGLDASVLDLDPTKPAPAPASSHRVKCDVCAAYPIVGVGYKCSQCPNFELCERCV